MAALQKLKYLLPPVHLITALLVISTLPLLVVLYLTYTTAEKSLLTVVQNDLKRSANYKASTIDSYIYQIQAATEALAENPEFVNAALKLNRMETPTENQKEMIRKQIYPITEGFKNLLHYRQLYLVSAGEIILSLNDKQSSPGSQSFFPILHTAVERAKTLMETELYNLPPDAKSQQQQALIAVPIAHQGAVVGVLALELSNSQIYKILRSTDGTFTSTEVIVGALQEGNEIILATPLKFDKSKERLSLSTPLDKATEHYLEAAAVGRQQQALFTDYRGQYVIAFTKYLPALRWGMLVKVDAAEAFLPITHLRQKIIWMGCISIALLCVVAYLLSKKLHRSQKLLIQQEKLASIGILTAGVAHEINNPINFITSNIHSLKADFADLLTTLDKYSKARSAADIEEVNKYKQEINLDTSVKEVESLLKGIMEGAQRTAAIVKDLKNISRIDSSELKVVDIHEGLNSSLELLKHTYKDHIHIVKNYGMIPPVECFPGKLNQVFMNILSNAIQAIPEKGTIKISTQRIGQTIEIRISDNGVGISERNKTNVFTPFFTTKGVGKGTGLGLSISHAIISDHHGKITFNSIEGQGSEFIVSVPLMQTGLKNHPSPSVQSS